MSSSLSPNLKQNLSSMTDYISIKTYLDHTDNNPPSDLSVEAVERVILGHFGIKDRFDLLVQA